MGRNAEKRKQRKAQEQAKKQPAQARGEEPVALSERDESFGPEAPGVAGWAARFLSGPQEIPHVEADGSLARALFHVTCLLALRDATKDPDDHLGRVAVEVARMVDADTVSLLKLEPGDDLVPARLSLMASHGLSPADVGLVSFDLGDGIAGQVALSGRPLRVEDAPRDERFSALYGQRTELGSLVAVPLQYDGRVLGVLTASRREVRAFHAQDEDTLLVIADSIAQDFEQTRMFQRAVRDPGTGLFSRLALLSVLPREVETARRYQTGLSLLLVDVDGLREVNERKGRSVGDRVLAEVARRVAARIRSADLAVRFGGDEFAVLLPMTGADQASQAAARLLPLLVEPAILPDETVALSMGVASLAAADEDALSLILRADEALAEAKRQGGGRFVAAPPEVRGPIED